VKTPTPSAKAGPITSQKFYVRSGQLSVVLTAAGGAIAAAKKFVVRAFQGGRMSVLGNEIEVSESGRFDSDDIIFHQETCAFLQGRLSVDDRWITLILARELYAKMEAE